jgi:hypothetical protein
MTTLTITIPDNKAKEISTYIEQRGGKVVSTVTASSIKRSQQVSLKQGLTEALMVKNGDIKSTPLSELWLQDIKA